MPRDTKKKVKERINITLQVLNANIISTVVKNKSSDEKMFG